MYLFYIFYDIFEFREGIDTVCSAFYVFINHEVEIVVSSCFSPDTPKTCFSCAVFVFQIITFCFNEDDFSAFCFYDEIRVVVDEPVYDKFGFLYVAMPPFYIIEGDNVLDDFSLKGVYVSF